VVPTRLFESESKALLKGYGVAIPKGVVLEKAPSSVSQSILSFPCILKAQVPVGGRGKAGGVVKVNDQKEAERQLQRIFSSTIGGFSVASVLAEEVVEAGTELYLSLLVDRSERCYALMAGSRGGVDIEQTAKEDPGSILRVSIQPLQGVSDQNIQAIASHLHMEAETLSPLVRAVYACFLDEDAELLEINPLVKTEQGLVALDAKIIIDDNALFRHQQLQQLPSRGKSPEELEAEKMGLNYVSLDGSIGIIGNGAGLTMATMDLVKEKGGDAANFLDLGAGARAERVAEAILFLSRKERVRGILVNVFGGMTRCDEVARGITTAISTHNGLKPIVVRLIGTNQELGEAILKGAGIEAFEDPHKAAEKIVSLVTEHP
jgi:succinyl-CoA synthetase beta subunit